jgi:hypothetical protein
MAARLRHAEPRARVSQCPPTGRRSEGEVAEPLKAQAGSLSATAHPQTDWTGATCWSSSGDLPMSPDTRRGCCRCSGGTLACGKSDWGRRRAAGEATGNRVTRTQNPEVERATAETTPGSLSHASPPSRRGNTWPQTRVDDERVATRYRQAVAESPPEPREDLSYQHVERGSARPLFPLVGALVPATQEFCDTQFGFGAVRRPTHRTPLPDPKGPANDHRS